MSAADLALVGRIAQFLYDYAATLDDERFDAWPALFDPDASVYEVLSRENVDLGLPAPIMGCYSHGMIRDRVAMLVKETLTYRHMYLHRQVTNVRARRIESGAIEANAGLVVHQSTPEGVASLYIVARYRAVLAETGDSFRINKMAVVVDSFAIDTMLAVPL